jgi:FkbM family methyltransferase
MTLPQKLRLLLLAVRGDDNARSLVRWMLKRPDHLLYEHRLRLGEVVYDVGGYRGDWTALMLPRYPCDYWVFEPHPEALQLLRPRFSGLPNVHLVEAALGQGDGQVALSSEHEGSSIVKGQTSNQVEVKLFDVTRFILDHDHRVALMKLNIEGAEYDLLESLLRGEAADRVDSVLVQFHAGSPAAARRYGDIAAQLSKDHLLQWRYPFLWELWSRRSRMPSG